MSTALVKIPFLLAAMLGAWHALTPPQPPPGAKERVKAEGAERAVLRSEPGGLTRNAQCSVLASLVAELVACILAATPLAASTLPFLAAPTPAPAALPLAFVLGCAATAASGALRLACYRALGALFTFELTLRPDHRLVTHGPYAAVRHPSYSGIVLGVAGTLLVHFGPGSWWARAGWLGAGALPGLAYAAAWCAMEAYVLASIVLRAPAEDALLRKQFGAEWDAWAARVRYRIIPGVY
ncbi:hypothetical protein BC834DRAFT_955012 [Gloeopeniophorella convolvens]|nr:hypothetical protein BC834DRAFT_955012 [Gloeopeniophorella convolvens]